MALVKSQCCLRGDVSLLETTELLTKLPAADLFTIMSCKVTQTSVPRYQTSRINILGIYCNLNLPVFPQEFNLSLLCPCLSMGVQRLARGQGSLLLETALQVTLEQLAAVTGSLPVPHQSFLPPSQPQPYWNQLADVYGESGREGRHES